MKRILLLTLVLALLCGVCGAALADNVIDFSGYSLNELYRI